MRLYKLAIEELLTPGKEIKIPLDDKTEGAEDLLMQAMKNNKQLSQYYHYKELPIILDIARTIGKSTDFNSLDFARNVFLYQVNTLGVPKNNADGNFDPLLIQKFCKRNNINMDEINNFWKLKLGKNYLGNRWLGRRMSEKSEGVYQYPVKSGRITGDFTGSVASDKRHTGGHWGIDLAAPKGTPLFPIAPGIVIAVGKSSKGGNWIKIDHGNGVESYYAHNDSIVVKNGDKVKYNTIIGSIGDSGNAKGTYPHVHLQTKVAGTIVDPKKLIGTPVRQL